MGTDVIILVHQFATTGTKISPTRFTIPIFQVERRATIRANARKWLRFEGFFRLNLMRCHGIDLQLGDDLRFLRCKHVAAGEANGIKLLQRRITLRAEQVKLRATGRARGRVRCQRRQTFRAKLLPTVGAGFHLIG